jgi:histidyl-tRNA synthetase
MAKHNALPGFRDFYPEEMSRRQQIVEAWRDVARRYGFEEYDGPPLEPLELYVEKSGPEIVNQLFNFTDKGGREVALRPEMTPTLVRMMGAKIKGMARPVRWFSTPQLFRYEKQQRGRLREHFQLNMDIVGEESVLADADLLAAALDVLRTLGLTEDDVVARYSDRRLLQQALLALGVAESDLPTAYNVIDKVERESREVLLKRLEEIGLASVAAAQALDLTTLSREEMERRYRGNPAFDPILRDLSEYETALRDLGFGGWAMFDMKIVRGLAYYTGIVFEIFDRKGALRAICGGGRYDRLFSSLADIDIPALGFGFGDVVLGELLKDRGLDRKGAKAVDVFVVGAAEGVQDSVLRTVALLRRAGKSVIYGFKPGGVGKLLKAAAASGAKHAILVGEATAVDVEYRSFGVKDLATGEQKEMTLGEFLTANP